MVRKIKKYKLHKSVDFKNQIITHLKGYNKFCFLDGNNSLDKYSSFDYLAAFEPKIEYKQMDNPFDGLKKFSKKYNDWMFGYFSYDLKNDKKYLESKNIDKIHFPKIHFFIPKYIFMVKKNELKIIYDGEIKESDIDNLFDLINNSEIAQNINFNSDIKNTISKVEYFSAINSIKKNIQLGDIYEMNFCQEFYVENPDVNPFSLFLKLNEHAKSPFSAFYRYNDSFCICSSPERFIKKKGKKIISQPIKGTSSRFDNLSQDELSRNSLLNSEKDFSENVMIVDLVRNDLSITAASGSVYVDELAKLYSYKNVHHLISTVVSEIAENINPIDVIKNAFPMGSMTGAPKLRSMELIEDYEKSYRGIYSGSIGYFTPEMDFDFNVVIRSLLYNQKSNYLSFMVGGAITIESDAKSEYHECLVKAKSILDILNDEK